MEVNIKLNDEALKQFGLGDFLNSTSQLNPIVVNKMMQGFEKDLQRQLSKPNFPGISLSFGKFKPCGNKQNGFSRKAMQEAESLARVGLKQDVKERIDNLSRKEFTELVLNRLSVNELAKLL